MVVYFFNRGNMILVPGKTAPGKCREEKGMHDTLHTRSVRTIFYERERQDDTTSETYPTAPGWLDHSLSACHCVRCVRELLGCTCAFCIHLGLSSFADYRCVPGGYEPQQCHQALDSG